MQNYNKTYLTGIYRGSFDNIFAFTNIFATINSLKLIYKQKTFFKHGLFIVIYYSYLKQLFLHQTWQH